MLPILILFGNSVAMTIYVSSDITMLELFKGAEAVGVYGVATKIYSVVKQILNAILIVTIPRMTNYIGAGEQGRFVSLGKKVLSALIMLMLPMVVGIIVFRTEAITLAGGSRYVSGSNSLMILSMAVSVALLATYYTGCVLMPLRKERYILQGTVISAIINVGLNFVFIPMWGGDGAAATTLISEIFVAVYSMFLVRKEGYRFLDMRILGLSVVGSVLVALVCMILKRTIDNFVIYFGLSIIASGLVYGAVHLIGGNPVVKEVLSRVRR